MFFNHHSYMCTATPEVDFLDDALGIRSTGVGDIIVTEVLQGFRSDKDFATAKTVLAKLVQLEMSGSDRATKAAENFRKLRKDGITARKTIDVIIASYCIAQKISLLFTDKDFKPFVQKLNLISALA